MIPYAIDDSEKIEGLMIPTMYIRRVMPAPATAGPGDFCIVSAPDDTPASFVAGMREIQEGKAIDFDASLREPPPVE